MLVQVACVVNAIVQAVHCIYTRAAYIQGRGYIYEWDIYEGFESNEGGGAMYILQGGEPPEAYVYTSAHIYGGYIYIYTRVLRAYK